ncbi:MAG: type II toxin-antitoxin system mRNA interferase toxin, RelE/StbE family [Thermoprotei archaeon]|nr:MAG: type II toxin-antitoxin system mRNA interferase toxin, RelE/StbE family [Thermoprotei archaeon]
MQDKVKEYVCHLKVDPFIGKKLRGMPYWSLRIGDYRLIYRVVKEEKMVILMTVFHRKRGYKRLRF